MAQTGRQQEREIALHDAQSSDDAPLSNSSSTDDAGRQAPSSFTNSSRNSNIPKLILALDRACSRPMVSGNQDGKAIADKMKELLDASNSMDWPDPDVLIPLR